MYVVLGVLGKTIMGNAPRGQKSKVNAIEMVKLSVEPEKEAVFLHFLMLFVVYVWIRNWARRTPRSMCLVVHI